MTLAKARDAALLANSYDRMEVMMDWCPQSNRQHPKLREGSWWRLLGEEWSSCDNVGMWSDVLRHLLRQAQRSHLDQMMSKRERAELAALGGRFRVWRGCYEFNQDGLSWTTDPAVAARFPLLHRYHCTGETPLLVEAVVDADQAVLKLDRKESEVIAHTVQVISVHELDPAPQRP